MELQAAVSLALLQPTALPQRISLKMCLPARLGVRLLTTGVPPRMLPAYSFLKLARLLLLSWRAFLSNEHDRRFCFRLLWPIILPVAVRPAALGAATLGDIHALGQPPLLPGMQPSHPASPNPTPHPVPAFACSPGRGTAPWFCP